MVKELVKEDTKPLMLVNGVETSSSLKELNPADIEAINVYKDVAARQKFGEKGRNGVVEVFLKKVSITLFAIER